MGGNQFRLLRVRRFAALFTTQFLGALNDNLFKQALIVWLALRLGTGDDPRLGSLLTLLFVAPFVLFSALAGHLGDKLEKSRLIRGVKLLEIGLIGAIAVGLYFELQTLLLALLFAMGAKAAMFGPLKYSSLPQLLRHDELMGGNALVVSSTFFAILVGTALALLPGSSGALVTGVLAALAVAGYVASRSIPRLAPAVPELAVPGNPFTQARCVLELAQRDRTVLLSILGIAWFWFFGAAHLLQFNRYVETTLGAGTEVMALLMVSFGLGLGIGSLLCEWLSGRAVELGLVPLGSIGLSWLGIDLFLAPGPGGDVGATALEFVTAPGSGRVVADVILLGLFGGLYLVPLYALVQSRTPRANRARIFAASGMANALFIVAAPAMTTALMALGELTPKQWFLVIALMNGGVAVYIYTLVPEFLMRCIVWVLTHTLYRIANQGLDHVPDEGAALLVCNHVSFVDALIIGSSIRRPVRFVMYHKFFRIPVLSFVFRTARTIPIAPAREDPEMLARAYEQIDAELQAGNLVCIFPEGRVTYDGEIAPFRHGVEKILERNAVPVLPMAIRGMWGSTFSRKGGKAFRTLPRPRWSRIGFVVGAAVAPENATAEYLYEQVKSLRGARK